MATFDIFNDNAFQLSQLTQTIVDIPRVPTMLGDMNLFTEYGINTPTMMIERTGSKLNLVPAAPRGAPGNPIQTKDRKLIPVAGVQLPQVDAIPADVVYGVRAFGSETEVQAINTIVQQTPLDAGTKETVGNWSSWALLALKAAATIVPLVL